LYGRDWLDETPFGVRECVSHAGGAFSEFESHDRLRTQPEIEEAICDAHKNGYSTTLLRRVEKLLHHRVVGFGLLERTKVTRAGDDDLACARNGGGEFCRMLRENQIVLTGHD
jgi:hypothetical protein